MIDRDAQATPTLVEQMRHITILPFDGRDDLLDIAADEIERLQAELTAATARAEEAEKLWASTRELLAFTSTDEENRLRTRLAALEAALREYVNAQGRMRDKWAEGDENVKRDLWRNLHACEEAARNALSALPGRGQGGLMNLSVKCKCVLCGHVENVGPQLEHPMCPKCMGPMIPMKAEAQHWNAGKGATP